jgi:hypothetical protein
MKPTFLDPIASFVKRLEKEIPRSDVWTLYLEFCREHAIYPVGRNEFYTKLLLFGCKVRKYNGNFLLLPPPRVKTQYYLQSGKESE